ncbi:hypothetical protein B5K05_11840 [Rhizobium phaseoli]|uniref:hypothetical protein n=1 Tax=Rhizobium phaseoli TaxID=396 RepID=UPI0002F45890|nr:hypothetical protein [Rhizobium phaseoli]KKZ89453.1 hypothetical protein RPHASCH2410_CH02320 [Rhizobium phaseoli Ch24-10]RDJ11658.1 hypothetical protein B5K04_11800 [Rhizobium phaseoli]RDJ14937.1 hypothetical protein B5K05_11840 [Rhizobium phaseoli]
MGDKAMLSFGEPDNAIELLGTLLQACRKEPRQPLTQAGPDHGPVIRKAADLFGSTMNMQHSQCSDHPVNCSPPKPVAD